ncbi:RNA-binding protein NOB1, partial [Lecanoromycetidae sp. Uapishka_2]
MASQKQPDSVKFVSDFSRRTGDKPALSTPDVQVLALAYELECEQNGGDWRLRNVPGQKKTNSPRRVKEASLAEKPKHTGRSLRETNASSDLPKVSSTEIPSENPGGAGDHSESNFVDPVDSDGVFKAVEGFLLQTSENDSVNGTTELQSEAVPDQPETDRTELESESESSNSEGWITPSNLKKQRNKDDNASTVPISEDKVLQVATITGDYAMQKEYQRAMTGRGRKEPNPMDEDYLPGILTGERGRYGGRPKVGAGRNVNSKKRAG